MTWSLFYRFDNGVPTDFHELRQFGSSLWSANGKVITMGQSMVAEFPSPQAAKDALVQRGKEIEAQGYKRVREGIHDPARIDFPLLTTEIRKGARRAFQANQTASTLITAADLAASHRTRWPARLARSPRRALRRGAPPCGCLRQAQAPQPVRATAQARIR
ncbi:hypothetical protein [Variovorax sp. tm]|uniref:hypothetical protein n=1 Tax=Variovorax atrisoli TaxID=3394203 RepID=UPI003A7F7651